MNTRSLWEDITLKEEIYPTLKKKMTVDIAIIGGGITGLTAALELMRQGKTVVILEANQVGSGTTGNSTGNLYIPIQPYYHKLLNKFHLDTLKLVAQSRQKAIDYIENVVNTHNVSCNFTRRPMYFYASHQEELEFLQKETETLNLCGIKVDTLDVTEKFPLKMPFITAARIDNQARFNPRQYVVTLAKHLQQQGCLIFENSRVVMIEEKNNQCIFKTEEGTVVAKYGIIATHTPIGINPIQLYTAAYRSYVVAVKLLEDNYPDMNCWNLTTPHYAMSTHSMSKDKVDLLLVAGSHHKTGQSNNTQSHFEELEKYLKKTFAVKEIKYRWSAQHYHAADGLPYIGNALRYKNIFEATGFFADGLVYGTMAGVLLADKINKKSNALEAPLNSKRHDFFASVGFLIKENFNTFLQYLKDMPAFNAHQQQFNTIPMGDAKVYVINGEKCGIYKDHNQKLHVVSAVCTHMKCIVHWNSAEKTWDCPCHGSRFTHEGIVIEGPAQENLQPKSLTSEE